MTWDYRGRKVVKNESAVLQPGVTKDFVIDDILDLASGPIRTDELHILTVEFDELVGPDPVTIVEHRSEVRYGFDPASKAKPHNQRQVPFVLRLQPQAQAEATAYLTTIGKTLYLVRAHFGAPYPPPPFTGGARNWPGYEHIEPGREGCREFWKDHALITYNPRFFKQCSKARPNWL